MLESILSGYLANLASELTLGVIKTLSGQTKELFTSPEFHPALIRCFQAAAGAMLPESRAEQERLRPILQTFFAQEDAQRALNVLVRGRALDEEWLSDQFDQAAAGQDLAGYDFKIRLAHFAETFMQAVAAEPVLVSHIQIEQGRQANASLLTLVSDTAAIRRLLEQRPAGSGHIEAGGDIHATNLVTGTQIIINPTPPPPPDPGLELGRRYLRALRPHLIELPLAALDDEGADSQKTRITLKQVYVNLNTQSEVELSAAEKEKPEFRYRNKRPVSALEAVAQNRCLALLGEAGGGKSVFVNYLAYQQVEAHLNDAPRPVTPPWPARFILRELAADLAAQLDLDKLAQQLPPQQDKRLLKAVGKFMLNEAIVRGLSPEEAQTWRAWFNRQRRLLIFDGLDEVPATQLRWVRRLIELLSIDDDTTAIVTCRSRAYTGPAVLPGFTVETLAPFTAEQQAEFIQAWYKNQPLDEATRRKRVNDMRQAVRDLPDDLTRNPLLLTTLALIHTTGAELPKKRAVLYKSGVEILMKRWQKHKYNQPSLLEQLGVDPSRMLEGLRVLALYAHEVAPAGQTADVDEDHAVALLHQVLGSRANAEKFLRYIDQQAGLLVSNGAKDNPLYRFAHRTFQEYLAGCCLAASREGLSRAICARRAQGERWYLVSRLAAEHVLYNDAQSEKVLDLLYDLCPHPDPAGEADWRGIAWAGAIAAEMDTERIKADDKPDGGPNFLRRLIRRLKTIVAQGRLTVPERADAGDALAALGGDDRPGVGLLSAPIGGSAAAGAGEGGCLPDHRFCFIPPGPFWLGSRKGEDDLAFDTEYGYDRPIDLPYSYWLGQYPVTQAQYQAFTQATGHPVPYQEADWAQSYNWRDGAPPPARRNHPVVLVNWRDAMAYCAWLTGQWGDMLPKGYAVRLPTEAEWEKAARGGLEIPAQPEIIAMAAMNAALLTQTIQLQPNPAPQRRWPWGEWSDDSPAQHANVDDSQRGQTMVVGSFPAGVSPYGCLDMSGNVWEWSLSQYQKYPYQNDKRNNPEGDDTRALRGGSWIDTRRNARVSSRYGAHPVDFDSSFGFRVVVAPVSPSF